MSAIPARPLLLLTAAVLAAHALLLRAPPGAGQPPERSPARPFVTRTVAQAAPVAAPAAAPAAAPQPLPKAVAPDAAPTRRVATVELPARATATAATPVAPQPPAQAASAVAPREAAAVPAVAAVAIPGSMRLTYKVEVRKGGMSLQANGQLHWRHDADSYEARLEVSAPLLPSRSQHSAGRITPEGLAPLRFSDKGRHEEAAHFERDKGKVSFSNNQPDAPLLAGAQDRLSVLLQLGAMIAGSPGKFPPGTHTTIQTAGTRDSEPWMFTVEGEEQLQLPGGKLAALKLIRNPRKEYDTKVELWLAPGMDYAPVRLRLTQPNGDSVDQQWSSTDRG
jgi:hypothetical protein